MSIREISSTSFTLLTILLSANIFADVTMDHRIKVEAAGNLSELASERTVITSISNNKSRSESAKESHSSSTASTTDELDKPRIMRLDRNLTWQLIPDEQQYSEMDFQQLRLQSETEGKRIKKMQQRGSAGALPVKEEDCRWSGLKVETRSTGERQRFANVKAKQYVTIVRETCNVPASGQTCDLTWSMENWMAKRIPGQDEATAFDQSVGEKMGLEGLTATTLMASRGLLGSFEEGWEEVLDEAGDLEGYPVKTVLQLEMSGPRCTAMSGQPIATDNMWGNALEAGVNSGARNAGNQARWAVTREASQAMGGGRGGSIAGSAVGAASGEVVSGLLKHFGKKKKAPQAQPAPGATVNYPAGSTTGPAADSAVLFRITDELTGINDNKIPENRFDIPAGWIKVSRK